MESSQAMGILLISHGACCEGLLDTLDMIVGEQQDINAFPLTEGVDPDVYREQIERWLDSYGGNAIILIDILGGTPFNQVMQIGRSREVHAVTGVNVAMAIEAAVLRRAMGAADLVEHLCETAMSSIQNVEKLLATLDLDDEDDEE